MASPLISTDALARMMGQPGLRVVDASWQLDGADMRAAFEARRIPGAVFFDLEAVSDPADERPHMLPSAAAFGAAMGALGLARDDAIVVYDSQGLFSAARAWWMLKTMGAADVRVLDGGLPKWLSEGRPVVSGAPEHPRDAVFVAQLDPMAVADFDDVKAALAASVPVIDARSAARFSGATPEPRPGLRSGHMPGAANLPFGDLLQADGTMKPDAQLRDALVEIGVSADGAAVTPITTCGSGVTAAIVSLALAQLGVPSRLYDGSWADWGARPDASVVTGSN